MRKYKARTDPEEGEDIRVRQLIEQLEKNKLQLQGEKRMRNTPTQ